MLINWNSLICPRNLKNLLYLQQLQLFLECNKVQVRMEDIVWSSLQTVAGT